MKATSPHSIEAFNLRFESAEAVIAWATNEFKHQLTFACSFGLEDMVVLDLLLKTHSSASVFILDTGRLHQETCNLIEQTRQHYRRSFDVYAPNTDALQTLLREQGPNSFYQSVEARKLCCHVRKVEPLGRALAGKKAWLTGLRREQSSHRNDLQIVEVDEAHGEILKINPLASWDEQKVREYIHQHHLPYNKLHDQGYPSIGCAPCTRAIKPGEDIRAGRWWWEQASRKECGLHSGKIRKAVQESAIVS
ncbi:MAG: phosphoadenylyl-sulfate reductase [bacterium]